MLFGLLPLLLATAVAQRAVAPVALDTAGESWAAETLAQMTLEEKIGQLFLVPARVQFFNRRSAEYLQLRELVRRYHVGGFGLTVATEDGVPVRAQPYEAALLTNQLQAESAVPLIFAADFERGLAMRLSGTTGFPHAMAFGAAGDTSLAFLSGEVTAREARAIGVQWNWYPIADVNSNPRNPIINTRAFGEEPQQVSRFVTAYIEGARGAGLLTTAKHFPGHGEGEADSHLGLPVIGGDRRRLDEVELPSFRAAIAAGVDSIMVAHLSVPAVEPDSSRPASLSEKVVTGLLRRELGFEGVIVTDALDMGALTRQRRGSPAEISARLAVEAFEAGNDMLVNPSDLDAAWRGLLDAVQRGEIAESRVDQSVLRILRMKASVGLHLERLVDLTAISEEVARPESLAVAARAAESAVTLVRDENHLLPLAGTSAPTAAYTSKTAPPAVVITFAAEGRMNEGGRLFERQTRTRLPQAEFYTLDEAGAIASGAAILAVAGRAGRVIVAVDQIPVAGRTANGTQTPIGGNSQALLASLLQRYGEKVVVVALGNPYIIGALPQIRSYLCVYSDMPVSVTAAVRALFGEIEIGGHLPVTIPGVAARGSGIHLTPVH
jgi:beta-N-acetylhexosaminidase